MNFIWGSIIIIFTLVGWLAQVITALWPKVAANLGLTEPETDVDSAFYADVRGEAFWDTAILWTLPVAGFLLVANNPIQVYFGLVGGGMYVYFAGRGIVVRRIMQRHGIQIGKPETLKVNYVFLTIWGLIAVITIIMAAAALPNLY